MKKLLLITLCAALFMSCASQRAAMVDSAIMEAKALQVLAKAQGIEVPSTADLLIASAEKKERRAPNRRGVYSGRGGKPATAALHAEKRGGWACCGIQQCASQA